MNKKIFSFFAVFSLGAVIFAADRFEFKHKAGDSYSYVSTVQEDVYINGFLNHHAEIINRISSSITEVSKDGSGEISANYMTTENSVLNDATRKTLSWGEETNSSFTRKKNGELIISDDIYMPTVRNVPVFPDKKLKAGDTWTADGKEVQDVRSAFNMKEALIFPFTAAYTYKEDVKDSEKNTTFAVIEVSYSFNFENTDAKLAAGETIDASVGYSHQMLYWDKSKGILDHYDEEFQIKIADIMGNLFIFQGTAHAEITEYKSVNTEENVEKIQETVDKLNLENVSVRQGEKGLTISLDNIQFEPDSDILRDSEKEKLKKIARILEQYANDLLITGHCAERGTVAARQKLSEERAESVASYLKQIGVRDEYHIFTQGKGSREPVATNKTEEGRAKNRRVEITIMD